MFLVKRELMNRLAQNSTLGIGQTVYAELPCPAYLSGTTGHPPETLHFDLTIWQVGGSLTTESSY